jgi:hypothetical protein
LKEDRGRAPVHRPAFTTRTSMACSGVYGLSLSRMPSMLPRKPDVPAGATLGVPRATSSSSNGCGGRLGNLRLRAHAAGSLIQKVPLCVVFERIE